MPQGLRYAPDGSSLIFAQNLRGSLADVWISQNSESPTLLYKSVLPNAVAFDKSSLRVAISSMRDNVPHASIVRLRDSLEEADLGVGIVAPGAWHPSESLLVCRVGVPQVPNAYDIVLVETFSPHRRTTVARVEGTVTCGPQFSTDGRRVLIGTNTAEGPVLRAYSVETGSKTFLSAARTISTERLQ